MRMLVLMLAVLLMLFAGVGCSQRGCQNARNCMCNAWNCTCQTLNPPRQPPLDPCNCVVGDAIYANQCGGDNGIGANATGAFGRP